MFISPFFLEALTSELASGRYPDLRSAFPVRSVVPQSDQWPHFEIFEEYVEHLLRLEGNQTVGLALGQRAPLTMLHVLGHLMAECADLKDTFSVLQRYSHTLCDGFLWYMRESERNTELGFSFDARVSETAARFLSEWMLGNLVRFGSQTVGAPALEVGFAHRAPHYAPAYGEVFGCEVRFSELTTWVRFSRDVRQITPAHRDPALFCTLRDAADRVLGQRASKRAFADRVRDALLREADFATIDMQRIARRLGTTRRMLRRRLHEEGQTVTNLLDEIRCEMAKTALRQGDATMKEIADRLGYSEASAFHRAFRRWTGQTPLNFRYGRSVQEDSSSDLSSFDDEPVASLAG